MDNGRDMRGEVEAYRQLVLMYEAVDEEIDRLIMQHGGKADKMPAAALEHYRALARRRDDLLNEMRVWEQTLLPGEDSSASSNWME